MHRRTLVVAPLAALLAFTGCRGRESPSGVAGAGGGPRPIAAPPPAATASPAPTGLLAGATCAFPKTDVDATIAAGCVVDVREPVVVGPKATLTIGPGATLRFHPATWLEIGQSGAKLVARGTADRPIVFTSAVQHPKRGDWIGLVFGDGAAEGTILEHAVVDWAGRETHGGAGAITVFRAFPAGAVALRDVVVRNSASAAVSNPHETALFGAFERNLLVDDALGMKVSAPVLAAIGRGNDVAEESVILGGTIRGKGAFPRTRGGLRVVEPVYVNGRGKDVASLTIERGSVLRFAPKTWMEIGTAGPAELVASGVTFTSAAPTPKAGDWVGLFFGDKTRRGRVSESTIEYAGAEEHDGDAAVTFVGAKSWQALDVSFSSVVFRQIQQAHFSSNGDGCDKALDPKFGIVWAGLLEPCR